MSDSHVQHIATVDPDDDWKQGWLGLLSRSWSIGVWIASNAIGTGVILQYVKTHAGVWVVIPVTLGVCGTGCLLFLRHERKHRTRSDHQLHALCHHLRDEAATVLEKGKKADGAKARFQYFNASATQYVAEFFQTLVGDRSISSAIRLAQTGDNGDEYYVTVARSSGMESSRNTQTMPIPASQGLPGKLLNAKNHGVLMIKDIKKAIESKDYFPTPNDNFPDCKSLIVSPINGWSDGKKVMIGVLSVSSRKINGFQQWHTTSLKAIADILGLVYPIMFARLTVGRSKGTNANQPSTSAPKSPKRSKNK